MKQTVCNNGLVSVVVGLVGAFLTGCADGGDNGGAGSGATTTTVAPGPATTAPAAAEALTVAYTRTSGAGDGRDDRPVPEHFQAELSADGASFRMTAHDGSFDVAYDAAVGTSYEWNAARPGVPETARLAKGLPTGGPEHHGLTDGPDLDVAVFVRALGRAGDSRVTTVTRHGRPAWHYDGPMVGNVLGGPPVEDHVVVDVDRDTGTLLLQAVLADGRETRRVEATSVEPRRGDDRRRYRPEPPATAEVSVSDHGFSAMTLDEVAGAAGYDVLVPASVPAGFELDEVLFDPETPRHTGAEAVNPAPARVTSMRWRGPAGAGFTVTLRPEARDPDAGGEAPGWSDPFGREGVRLPAGQVSIALDGRPPLDGEVVVAAPAVPHLWGGTGDLVVTVDGDLDAAGLEAVARSLRPHPRPAASRAAPVACPSIPFAPNTDDQAGNVVATGMGCDGAEALIRRVKEARDVGTGARLFRTESFLCRAVYRDEALPNTEFRCDDGARRVTWTKT